MSSSIDRDLQSHFASYAPPQRRDPHGAASRVVMFDPGNFLPYYLKSLCGGLRKLGVSVRAIASPPLFEAVDTEGLYQVDCLFFPFLRGFRQRLVRHRRAMRQAVKALTYPVGLVRTWLALRRGAPGVLHAQWTPIPMLDGLLLRALKAKRWLVVYTAHDPPPDSKAQRLAWRQHRWMLGAADAVIVHTPEQASRISHMFPAVGGRVHIIAHGGLVHPLPAAAERLRHRNSLGIDEQRPLLLFFGLIKAYKGLDYLLAAMPDVAARFPRALLVVAGEPLIPLRPFERQIDKLGLRDHVLLRPGFVPENIVPVYIRAADLLIAPYVKIGASGVVVLAQGHGVPVIVTRVGGLPGFVEPDRCGFVVPPRAPRPLADAICSGLSDRAELAEMGRRGRLRLARDNRWSDVAEQTLGLYERICAARSEEGVAPPQMMTLEQ